MNDVLRMQIAKNKKTKDGICVSFNLVCTSVSFHLDLLHALSSLPGDVYQLDYLEVCLQDMDMFVEAASLTPLGHNGQIILRHVAHEQQDVDMSCFPTIKFRPEEAITNVNIRFQ